VYGGKKNTSAAKQKRFVTQHVIAESNRRAVRVLLAEDNSVNQKVALAILKKMGLRADAVANGQEAIQSLEDRPYDLVLMDCQMPEMDGFEATRTIRKSRSVIDAAVPIIALTASVLTADREECLAAGMNDFLTKPINPQALAETLEKWLPKSDGSEQV